jgi:hypothetical protein
LGNFKRAEKSISGVIAAQIRKFEGSISLVIHEAIVFGHCIIHFLYSIESAAGLFHFYTGNVPATFLCKDRGRQSQFISRRAFNPFSRQGYGV